MKLVHANDLSHRQATRQTERPAEERKARERIRELYSDTSRLPSGFPFVFNAWPSCQVKNGSVGSSIIGRQCGVRGNSVPSQRISKSYRLFNSDTASEVHETRFGGKSYSVFIKI